jgi:hypothetical protein
MSWPKYKPPIASTTPPAVRIEDPVLRGADAG